MFEKFQDISSTTAIEILCNNEIITTFFKN